MRKALLLAAVLSTTVGCGLHHRRHVRVGDVALGRVVVYRNGVAYYERRAQVRDGQLVVNVPRDQVDDFLKSLTVVDAISKRPLPVSFPRTQSTRGPYIDMTLQVHTDDGRPADVVMTYVTEAPAWKPSYRLVVGGDGKVLLEGWAIVDNLTGEDWKDVKVGVGSSAALSFRYDLWSVRTIDRATLASDAQFAVAPPTAISPYGGSAAGDVASGVVLSLDADEIRNIPVPGRTFGSALGSAPGSTQDGYGVSFSGTTSSDNDYVVDGVNTSGETIEISERAPSIDPSSTSQGITISQESLHARPIRRSSRRSGELAPSPDPARSRVVVGDQKLAAAMPALEYAIGNNYEVVVEGNVPAGAPDAQARALDQANAVRNQLIDAGLPPARVRAVGKVGAADQAAGVRLLTGPEVAPAEATGAVAMAQAMSSDVPVGESHFESSTPMTVAGGSSAMVSMVRRETEGEQVYLYDAESERGNDHFAFKAVRLTNPTDSTLEAGPVTVYGDGRYIGEGLTEPIPPSAPAVIPYALDRQVVVDRDDATDDRLSRLVTVQRGVLTAEVQHIKRTRLTLTSRLRVPTRVYLRHTVSEGWNLLDGELPRERVGKAHLFEVDLAPGQTRTVEIAQATPLTRTLDLGADDTLGLLQVFVESSEPSPLLRKRLVELLALHRTLVDTAGRIDGGRERLAEYRARADELTGQLVSLRKVKHAASLSRHLADKLDDVSARIQATTMALVDNQEALMLARVRFQDALAELRLSDAALAAQQP